METTMFCGVLEYAIELMIKQKVDTIDHVS
jgi:hypothetical protein